MSDNHNELFIIDLGLCKPISDSGNKVNEIYGVLPYMAPEILRNKPYTPASDIYSLSMIMWEFTSGTPPFYHEAHDHHLSLDICRGKRPEIKKNTPKCYIDLMKNCWDSNPSNRPTVRMLENIVSEWVRCINEYYKINRNGSYSYLVPNIDNQLKDDMLEFVKANKTLVQEQANTSIVQSHPQAYYISRKFTGILAQEKSEIIVQEKSEILAQEKSECFECIIVYK
ncbi:kinase-like domain-containing protein [Rhizophagus irregularis DAOM 181602=DAOM 197198]|nr:kinase-like domain-containing protein [Rhizophagus irregularis DAOM 181602=DAOM 197198]